MKKTNIILRRKGNIDLWNADVEMFVVRDVVDAANQLKPSPNIDKSTTSYDGLCLSGKSIVVFFQDTALSHGLIAHELFHATHRVLISVAAEFHAEHQEPFAYTNEWLHKWVYSQLKKAKLRIR